jgi:hypothetical protein
MLADTGDCLAELLAVEIGKSKTSGFERAQLLSVAAARARGV